MHVPHKEPLSPQNRCDTHDFHKSKTEFFFIQKQKGVVYREEEKERSQTPPAPQWESTKRPQSRKASKLFLNAEIKIQNRYT